MRWALFGMGCALLLGQGAVLWQLDQVSARMVQIEASQEFQDYAPAPEMAQGCGPVGVPGSSLTLLAR